MSGTDFHLTIKFKDAAQAELVTRELKKFSMNQYSDERAPEILVKALDSIDIDVSKQFIDPPGYFDLDHENVFDMVGPYAGFYCEAGKNTGPDIFWGFIEGFAKANVEYVIGRIHYDMNGEYTYACFDGAQLWYFHTGEESQEEFSNQLFEHGSDEDILRYCAEGKFDKVEGDADEL